MKAWKTYERHELSAAYEDLAGPAWDSFLAGFADGFMAEHSIVLHEGKIIDGWQRQRACVQLGIEPVYRTLDDGTDLDTFVAKVNDHRRHETAEQVARRLAERRERVAKMRADGASIRTIAAAENVSKDTVEKDLEKISGVRGRTPENTPKKPKENEETGAQTVKGGDGKTYQKTKEKPRCDRCTRKGLDGKNCEDCKEIRKPKPKPKKAEPEPVIDDKPWVDGWGIPITKKAAPAFHDVEKFDALLTVLRQAKKLYKELADSPGGRYLTRPGISANTRNGWQNQGIENAIRAVKDCTPTYTVCPYAFNEHHDHGKECVTCHGLEWLCDVNLDAMPQALIDAAKKANGGQA